MFEFWNVFLGRKFLQSLWCPSVCPIRFQMFSWSLQLSRSADFHKSWEILRCFLSGTTVVSRSGSPTALRSYGLQNHRGHGQFLENSHPANIGVGVCGCCFSTRSDVWHDGIGQYCSAPHWQQYKRYKAASIPTVCEKKNWRMNK